MSRPLISVHDGILVVRDDMYPGGSKARFIPVLFDDCDEIVYASPPQGGAQSALAWAARACGKRATIFGAARAQPHPRQLMAMSLGARVEFVRPGYLTVVQSRAREYCASTGAKLAPFGFDYPEAIKALADAAYSCGVNPAEVWCAAGSGVLSRALAIAFPYAQRHAVQIGRDVSPQDVAGAQIHIYPKPFDKEARQPPFPSDPHYDAKAWEMMMAHPRLGNGPCLFWNVTGPAQMHPPL